MTVRDSAAWARSRIRKNAGFWPLPRILANAATAESRTAAATPHTCECGYSRIMHGCCYPAYLRMQGMPPTAPWSKPDLGRRSAIDHVAGARRRLDGASVARRGCGYGTFIALARAAGWDAMGMDYSSAAASAAQQRYGIDVQVGDFALHGTRPAALRRHHNVGRHRALPRSTPGAAFGVRRTKPGGQLILSTPDTNSWDARVLGSGWYGYTKVPEHLWYFNRETLTGLAEQAGSDWSRVDRGASCARSASAPTSSASTTR